MQYLIRHEQQHSYFTTLITACLIKYITGIVPKFSERFHNR